MFALVITEKGGEQRRIVFNKPEITIGRVQGNDIVLPKGNVSKRHARIVLKDGKFIIVDLKSTNGTYVNGRKITSPLVVKEADKIYIGDFIMGVEEDSGGESMSPSEGQIGDVPSAPIVNAPPPRETREPPPPPSSGSPELLRAALQRQEPPRAGGSSDHERQPPRAPPAPATLPPPAPPAPSAASVQDLKARPQRPAPGGTLPPPAGGLGAIPPMPAMSPHPPPMSAATLMSPPAAPLPPHAPAPMVFGAPMPPDVAVPAASLGHAAAVVPNVQAALPPVAPSPAPEPRPPVQSVPLVAPPVRPRLVGVGARTISPRPVGPTVQRGVLLEPLDPKVVKMHELQMQIVERLRPKLDLDNLPIERLSDEDLWQQAERAIVDLVEILESSGELPSQLDHDALIKETLNEALGLGPLEDLLADDSIDEILIDRRDRIVVGRDGVLRGSGRGFSSDDAFRRVVDRLVAPTGQSLDDDHPIVDVRLRDGSRLTAVVSPIAVHGPCLTLNKSVRIKKTVGDLVTAGALSSSMADFLALCVVARRNLIVCGPVGVGKRAVMSALAGMIREGERVVTVEDVAELSFDRNDWIALETRQATSKAAAVDLAQLVRTALRMRPDRLVVGEMSGAETFELATALGSMVDGAVLAVTGDGIQAALTRWVLLAQLSAPGATESTLRELVAGAADIAVHVTRFADGQVRVVAIDEVRGVREVGFDLQTLFSFHDGAFHATGIVPRFWNDLEARGIVADPAMFKA